MTATNGHAALIHATGMGLTPRQEALARMHDDLRRAEATVADTRKEVARLERERDRLQGKLDKHAAARTAEALAKRVLQVGPNEWRVPSDTADGGSRTVTYSERFERYACDCESNTWRRDCRHVESVSISIQGRVTANTPERIEA